MFRTFLSKHGWWGGKRRTIWKLLAALKIRENRYCWQFVERPTHRTKTNGTESLLLALHRLYYKPIYSSHPNAIIWWIERACNRLSSSSIQFIREWILSVSVCVRLYASNITFRKIFFSVFVSKNNNDKHGTKWPFYRAIASSISKQTRVKWMQWRLFDFLHSVLFFPAILLAFFFSLFSLMLRVSAVAVAISNCK